jgi:hypothetical protein
MARVTVNWVLPTTRESGKPLAVSAIKDVLIEVSADGTSYTTVGRYPPTTLTTLDRKSVV